MDSIFTSILVLAGLASLNQKRHEPRAKPVRQFPVEDFWAKFIANADAQRAAAKTAAKTAAKKKASK